MHKEDWSIFDTSFTSHHHIPALQDRVLTLSDTSKALCENQRMIALELDRAYHKMTKLEKRIMSVCYPEGERS